jgi:hypothetical protein
MGPGNGGGLGSAGGAVLAALVVAVAVLAIVEMTGPTSGSLISHESHIAAAGAHQSQG